MTTKPFLTANGGVVMGLFSRKRRLTVEGWCENFYSNVLFSNVGELSFSQIYSEKAIEQIGQADPSFLQVEKEDFANELLALWLEVIGVAWFIHEAEDLLPIQSQCTRMYLQENDRGELWDMMEPYNHSVAKSSAGGIDSNTARGRAEVDALNAKRVKLFEKATTKVGDPKDAARPVNRTGCKAAWRSGRTPVYLSFALTNQLQCDLRSEARPIITDIIYGFFNGASEDLSESKIVAS